MINVIYLRRCFLFFILLVSDFSYAHTLSINKVGMHDYVLNGSISSSELEFIDTKRTGRGTDVYYHSTLWYNSVGADSLGNNCSSNKELAAQNINKVIKGIKLYEKATYNNKDSNVAIYCRVDGGKGVWAFTGEVILPESSEPKGCQVNTSGILNFGTVQETSKKTISSKIYIHCDKDSSLDFYFDKTDRPGFLIMGGTVIQYGFGISMSTTIRNVKVQYGDSATVELVLQLIDTGNELTSKQGVILLVADIV